MLIVEESRSSSELIVKAFEAERRLRVAGVVVDGEDAVDAARLTSPDVIAISVRAQHSGGFDLTRRIMESSPAPIVAVCPSANTSDIATTFRAIEAGALAVVGRPEPAGHPRHEASVLELTKALLLMSEVKVVRRWPRQAAALPTAARPQVAIHPRSVQAVAIGASTGGPPALQIILAGLPKPFPVAVLIVQHMTPGFVQGFVDWLGPASGFPTRVATDGEPLLPGHAYVAPDGVHMGVRPGNRVLLCATREENGMRPAVAFLFRSVAAVFGAEAIGVLLSGMGRDGAEELGSLKSAGGVTIAQDAKSSVVHGMPGEAIQLGAAKYVLTPEAIAQTLTRMVVRS
ncbi:MAG: chemotaxis protein CheB [Steroidobacteraceae bacterium]